jgi:hypothetical protein
MFFKMDLGKCSWGKFIFYGFFMMIVNIVFFSFCFWLIVKGICWAIPLIKAAWGQ